MRALVRGKEIRTGAEFGAVEGEAQRDTHASAAVEARCAGGAFGVYTQIDFAGGYGIGVSRVAMETGRWG